jgi:hypothetical protein
VRAIYGSATGGEMSERACVSSKSYCVSSRRASQNFTARFRKRSCSTCRRARHCWLPRTRCKIPAARSANASAAAHASTDEIARQSPTRRAHPLHSRFGRGKLGANGISTVPWILLIVGGRCRIQSRDARTRSSAGLQTGRADHRSLATSLGLC